MRQREIFTIINKRFKKIDKLFSKIPGRFEVESVHDFRTEVKKLRAFLRLLNVETNTEKSLKISKKIKVFYGYAGIIRNLQLQLKNMDACKENPQYTVMEAYTDYLKKIIEKWKANSIEFARRANNFHNGEKKIIKHLPGKLRKASIKKFLQNKINELSNLIKALPDDEVLHSIRKLLKDILYNWAFLEPYSKRLPLAFSKEEKIKSFTELIGLFLDKSVAIILLETYCKDCEENGLFTEKEIAELQGIEGRWKNEKQALSHIIYLNPGLLQLLPVS